LSSTVYYSHIVQPGVQGLRGFLTIVVLTTAALLGAACGRSSEEGGVATREPGLAFVRIGALAVQAEVPEGDAFYRGLGGREALPDDRGMLFVFPDSDRHAFWMKDMLIPIDIIWVSAEGRVVDIQTAQPEPGVPDAQLKRYSPIAPAQHVLEVRAGLAAEKGVQPGDEARIELP
jgi:uncharacterized membrane protein (UPF0127 family)